MLDESSNEPAIRDRVTLETQDRPRTLVHRATIANLTTEEVWVVVGPDVGHDLVSGSPVRIVVIRSGDRGLAADTSVRRFVGGSGRIAALVRPEAWVSHSRRAGSRDPWRRQLVVAFRFVDLTADDEARVAEALAALRDETDATAVPTAWRGGKGRDGGAR
jgi:hypothetical protein